MNGDLIMFLECHGRTAAVKGILGALSDDLPAVWFGVFLVEELGEFSERTDAEVYGFHDCKNK